MGIFAVRWLSLVDLQDTESEVGLEAEPCFAIDTQVTQVTLQGAVGFWI